MPTFKRRPEYADARQFTGGIQNGMELVFWVNSHHGKAFYKEARRVGDRILSERIVFEPTYNDYVLVWVNDWFVLKQDGSWEVLRPEDLNEKYEQV